MINVLFIETSTGFGGSGKYLWELIKRLDRTKFNSVLIYSGDGLNIQKIKALGIKNHRLDLSFPRFPKSFRGYIYQFFWILFVAFPRALRISALIAKHSIDVVYLNNEILSHIPSILAAKLTGKKIVCHNHGLRKLTALERLLLPWINWIICVSRATFEIVKEDIGNRPVSVVHNGLDIADYDLDALIPNARLNRLKNSNYLVGIFGRIIAWKGHHVFVKAAALVAQRLKNVRFVIMGDDLTDEKKFFTEIKAQIARLGLEDQFIFTGWQSDVMSMVLAMDVVAHPSIEPEPFGLTIIEAMALQRAVVASRLGAIVEIIEDQADGLLFEAGNADDLAEKIIFLLSNDPARVDLGKKARIKVQERFGIKKNVETIELIVERVSR